MHETTDGQFRFRMSGADERHALAPLGWRHCVHWFVPEGTCVAEGRQSLASCVDAFQLLDWLEIAVEKTAAKLRRQHWRHGVSNLSELSGRRAHENKIIWKSL